LKVKGQGSKFTDEIATYILPSFKKLEECLLRIETSIPDQYNDLFLFRKEIKESEYRLKSTLCQESDPCGLQA
jgi:hypothetical protein